MIATGTPPDHSLPLWAQVVALATSLALAAIQIFQFTRRPHLEVHLTRDLFFRLINQGEALFCKAVLLARNGPVLVRDVQPVLRRFDPTGKRSQAEKLFPLDVWRHGESVRGSNIMADHHFFGSSPLAYIEADSPQRAVYLCLQREYWGRQKAIADQFVQAVEALRQKYQSFTPDLLSTRTPIPSGD
jgi:hypothetical protein